jgi:hypothetical protein
MTSTPERRRDEGDGGTSDDDRQPDDAGQTGTLGEQADDLPVPGEPDQGRSTADQ